MNDLSSQNLNAIISSSEMGSRTFPIAREGKIAQTAHISPFWGENGIMLSLNRANLFILIYKLGIARELQNCEIKLIILFFYSVASLLSATKVCFLFLNTRCRRRSSDIHQNTTSATHNPSYLRVIKIHWDNFNLIIVLLLFASFFLVNPCVVIVF